MTTLRYVGRILTPVHVGTGETIDPLDYIVRDGRLVRFSPSAVVADLPAAERDRLERLLTQGDLRSLQTFFRNHVDPARHAIATIRAGEGVIRRFEEAVGRPLRSQLKVRPMIRNLHTGAAYLPGSSIKGAIRTALVNRFANDNAEAVRGAIAHERNDRQRARKLEEVALGYDFRRLERDPLRALKVSDADLPDGCTQVDEVFNVKPSRDQDMPVDMWERCRSLADGEHVRFEVEFRIDVHLFEHSQARRHLGRPFGWADILEACNQFYWARLKDEDERFYQKMGGLLRSVLFLPFLQGAAGEKQRAVRPRPPAMLLRLGRFTQFESKSVDGFREGWNMRARRVIKAGSTRNLVPVMVRSQGERRRIKVPFGWVLLSPANA